LLAAASLLGQIRVHQQKAGSHLAEIADTRAWLDRAREENRGMLEELEAWVGKTGPELSGDPRITQPTRAAFEEAEGRVLTVRGWIDAGREDPLQAAQELLAAREGLDQVETMAPEDRRLHDEAVLQIEKAGVRVGEAGGWSGPYGVVIQGRPGESALEIARSLLGQQRYGEAQESALAAFNEADSALCNALAVVARRRAEEAEERRDDERRRQSSSSFSSRSSSSGSSRSSSSSSSRSSGGGRRSGSGKSGW
jgi:uncharacterized membrane protein YgcG